MMRPQVSKIHSSIAAANVRPFDMKEVSEQAVRALARIGIAMDAATVQSQLQGLYAMDANFGTPATPASLPTPVQFLQTWLPGFVKVMTAARKIDELVGIQTVGAWEDEEIVQGVLEQSGNVKVYGDLANVPLATWNTNFERRSVVRSELGLSVGILEEARTARMKVSSANEKRQGVGLSLEITRNLIGFNGFNNGANRTFGFLNDPSLSAYVSVPAGAGGTTWTLKTFDEITKDIRLAVSALRNQSQDTIDPMSDKLILALPTSVVDNLSAISALGYSVRQWLKETYPNIRVVSAPQLNQANGGANVFYLYPEKIDSAMDGSTDGGDVFAQLVPAKFQSLGVEKRVKTYVESYSNATAGVMLKRPYAVVRYTGI